MTKNEKLALKTATGSALGFTALGVVLAGIDILYTQNNISCEVAILSTVGTVFSGIVLGSCAIAKFMMAMMSENNQSLDNKNTDTIFRK